MKMYYWIALLVTAGVVWGQPPDTVWTRIYGGQYGEAFYDVQQTSDGGYILAGFTFTFASGGESDMWLMKTDADGDSQWTRAYGGISLDLGESVIQTTDGGYAIAGFRLYEQSGWDWWLIKTDSNGDSLWSRRYGTNTGNDQCFAVKQTTNGGFILAGAVDPENNGHSLGAVVKTDINGDTLWCRFFGGSGWSVFRDVQESSDGGYVLGGRTSLSSNEPGDYWLVKVSADGDSLWSRTYGGGNTDYCYTIDQTEEGGFVLAGVSTSFSNSNGDFWLVRTNADGDSLWSRIYRKEYEQVCYSVRQTMDDGYILAGQSMHSGGNLWLLKADTNGDSIWSLDLGGDRAESGYSVRQTIDGGYIVAGWTSSFTSGPGAGWLVKTGPELSASVPLIVQSHILLSNYPNPFNATTTFSFSLPHTSPVSLTIFNLLGQAVYQAELGMLNAGEHRHLFDARELPSGVYLARVQAGEQSQMRKMVLLK